MGRNIQKKFDKIKPSLKVYSLNTNQVSNQATKMVQNKKVTNELVYKKDNTNMPTRFKHGFEAKKIVEQIMGESFIDYSVHKAASNSKPDLHPLGYNVNIYVSRVGKAHMVPHDIKYGGIFLNYDKDCYYNLGYGSAETINKYVDIEEVDTKEARERKTGFYEIEELQHFDSFQTFEAIFYK